MWFCTPFSVLIVNRHVYTQDGWFFNPNFWTPLSVGKLLHDVPNVRNMDTPLKMLEILILIFWKMSGDYPQDAVTLKR